MRTQKTINLFKLAAPPIFVVGLLFVPAAAQTSSPSPQPHKASTARDAGRVILENKTAAPQVVTILHSLNGLKVFRLLVRSQEQVEAIARLDPAFDMTGEVHTNVIAGLALDDGHTIAAWLPEAEAEMPFPAIQFAPRVPTPPQTSALGTPPDCLLERRETRAMVRACIAELPDNYRTVLILRDIEQLSTDETAQMLGVTTTAVKVRLHRARQALATLIRPQQTAS